MKTGRVHDEALQAHEISVDLHRIVISNFERGASGASDLVYTSQLLELPKEGVV